MSETTIRGVLRIGALFVMLYALVEATAVILTTAAVQAQIAAVDSVATRMAGWSVAVHLATFAWGLVFYGASEALARRVAR